MKHSFIKWIVLVIIFIVLSVFVFLKFFNNQEIEVVQPPIKDLGLVHSIIGTSVEGRNIDAYTLGTGSTPIIFIGGIHGGYEWNSVVLAYQFVDYIEANPSVVPKNITVTIIPSLNPDGVFKVVGKEGRFTSADISKTVATAPGRFNANGVDLNRNFDCKWKPKSTWKGNVVSAGTKPFSEPEALAFQKFITEKRPESVIWWHSQANAVYASDCEKGILPETLNIMNTYAKASGYQAIKSFDAYETSGDAEGWLASIGIPSITVELKTHETIEWEENLKGVLALFEYYNKGK